METNKFLERFNFFYDSVIRNVEITFRNHPAPTKIEIIISARDKETTENDSWVNIRLEIIEAVEFNFREGAKDSHQVISDGLHILDAEGLFYFDFGFHTDAPVNAEEYRKSGFYVVGRSFSWQVEEYTQ